MQHPDLFRLKWLALITTLFSTITTALSPPACKAVAAPAQQNITHANTTLFQVPGLPFGVVYATLQKDVAFVSLNPRGVNSVGSLGVLNISTFTPTWIRSVPIPAAYAREGLYGITLTRDGKYVYIASGPGAVIVDTALAVNGSRDAVVGTFNGTTSTQKTGDGAIQITLSKNESFAFVSQEYGPVLNSTPGNVDVFKVGSSGLNVTGMPVGYLSLGFEVVGTALSPNGKTLYATSESFNGTSEQGIISVIDVATLETNSSDANLGNVSAGCEPVRAIVSRDGSVVWVTSRQSNHLLAFNASRMISHPNDALIASVQVGTLPVGLTFFRNETRILTADSNRENYPNATTGLSVVNVQAALAGNSSAVLGRVATGLFPREFATSLDGKTILVADYNSSQVQVVDVSSLP